MDPPYARLRVAIITTSHDDSVKLHLSTTSVIRHGTLVYHKTMWEFPPSENRSMYYTMLPPVYTHADRGQRVIEYVTVEDLVVLEDLSRAAADGSVIPLKYAMCCGVTGRIPSSCLELHPHMNAIVENARGRGYHALLSRMDAKNDTMELVCFRPTSLLRFVREYQLTSP